MEKNVPDQSPTHEPEIADPQRAAGPGREAGGTARRPYARPRLIEHGRLSTLTFGKSGAQSDRNAKERFESIDAQAILPGVREYVDEARRLGLRLGVASSSSRRWVEGHLQRLGLRDRFDVIRCADDVPRVKPDPALYRAVLDATGVRPEDAMALEDSPNGVLAAKRAGLTCVAVPNALTARLDLSHADLSLTSLADLPLAELLSRIRRPAS